MVSLQAKSLESNIDTGKEQGGIELSSLLFRCLESIKYHPLILCAARLQRSSRHSMFRQRTMRVMNEKRYKKKESPK